MTPKGPDNVAPDSVAEPPDSQDVALDTAGRTRSSTGMALRRLRLKSAWRMPLAIFAWAQLILALWWAGDYPGLLSPDSIRHVIHVTVGPWIADQSVLYDSMVLASLDITKNVALLTFLQTTAAAATLGYAVASLRTIGVRPVWAAVPAFVLPLLPSFGAFITTVWKDIPFALCEILIMATLVRIVARRCQNRVDRSAQRGLSSALGVEFLGLVLFRTDGFVMLTLIVVILVLALPKLRLIVLGLGLASIIALFVATSLVYPAAGIKPANASLSYGLFYADISVTYAEMPRIFTAADKRLLRKVAPLSVWAKADNCYYSDPLFHDVDFDLVTANQERGQLLKLWFHVLERAPWSVARARLCRGAVAWDPLPPPASKSKYGVTVVDIPYDLYGKDVLIPTTIAENLRPSALNSSLGRFTHWLRAGTTDEAFQVSIFRGAVWCYLAYLALLVAARRLRRWDVFAIGAVALAQQVTVTLLNPAQLFRYMAGAMFVAMLVLPIAFVRKPRPDDEPAETAGVPNGSDLVPNDAEETRRRVESEFSDPFTSPSGETLRTEDSETSRI